MAKKNKPVVIETRDRRHLMCDLTEAELAEAAQSLARHLDDYQALEDYLSAIKQQFKANLDRCKADIQKQKRLVRERKELRMTDVAVSTNYTTCRLTVTRTDTGEVIEDRKLRGEERQMKASFANEIDAKADDAKPKSEPTGNKAA